MTRVRDQTIGDYLQALASTAAVPGGGSAAALAAAMGAALVSMVAKLSAKRARTDEIRAALAGLVPELDQLADRLLELSQDDVDAYRAVLDARKSGALDAALERAYEWAAEVPLAAASAAARGLALAAATSQNAWDMTASDLAVGTKLLQTGRDGALANVAINLPELRGEPAVRIEHAYRELMAKA
jgi:methenyltetrahydrofolate cyclohydrolase